MNKCSNVPNIYQIKKTVTRSPCSKLEPDQFSDLNKVTNPILILIGNNFKSEHTPVGCKEIEKAD